MTKSPFIYGEKVMHELFIGRDLLINDLIAHIKAQQNLIIYGSRRIGKSSLIEEAISRFQNKYKKDKHLFLSLDLSQFSSTEEFIGGLCTQIHKLIKEVQPLKTKFKQLINFVSSIQMTPSINHITGDIEYSFGFSGPAQKILATVNEVFDLLENISKTHNLTIIFDEFQTIVDWDKEGQLQWLLRSRVQKIDQIGYVFLGSSRKLISKLFMESKSAFYRSGVLILVEDFIDEESFFYWIKKRFKKYNCNISSEVIKKILEISRCHPYYTQKICYHLWIDHQQAGKKEWSIDFYQLELTIKKLHHLEQAYYQERLSRLTKNQRQVLKAVSKLETKEKLLSKTIQKKYALPAKAAISVALKALAQEPDPIVTEFQNAICVEDPIFDLWLKA